jgi:hypothetical protein
MTFLKQEIVEFDSEQYLKNEGIINVNDNIETVYLQEDEIEKFMAKYLAENPDVEIETRYMNQPAINATQSIQVRWLRPETPELPPIIINEIEIDDTENYNEKCREERPIRVKEVKRRDQCQDQSSDQPIIIREKPPMLPISDPNIVYVQNVIKKKSFNINNNSNNKSLERAIRIEHLNSSLDDSRNIKMNNNSRLDFDEQQSEIREERDQRGYLFEEHRSFDEYEESVDVKNDIVNSSNNVLGSRTRITEHSEERDLKMYEEQLRDTLYAEYLIKVEREALERKLRAYGVNTDKYRDMNTSLTSSRVSNPRLSTSNLTTSVVKERNLTTTMSTMMNQSFNTSINNNDTSFNNNNNRIERANQRPRQLSGVDNLPNDTSTYKTIRFKKVTDPAELKRLNAILDNPNAASIKSREEGDKLSRSVADITQYEQEEHDRLAIESSHSFRNEVIIKLLNYP